ncbi:MAG: phenylalanine--tRNA ligase subunit alpha [Candidatus Marinimicrobia bacterium]|nr:phenylalanine--tRNA ligase subunit alpha [Candidatus Neomarinimicrobiota bacterium]
MSIFDKINDISNEFQQEIKSISEESQIVDLKNKYLGRKGTVADLFSMMGKVEPTDRKKVGQSLNSLKNNFAKKINEIKQQFSKTEQKSKDIDLSLSGYSFNKGSQHPLTQAIDEMLDIFNHLGFDIAYGPEVETDWFNFESLNFPPNHPARDMQDTFYTEGNGILRTHTSPVQTRFMKKNKPPIRIVAPGRVYRNEAISPRSYCLFNQIEGLYVDENVTFSELRGTLDMFCKMYFGSDVKLKFRTSYFPFTEPSAEVDVSCFLCGGKGCRVCKNTGWLEILGCGMVDPNVFKSVGYDSEKYSGFAFGLGVERMTMLKLGIKDIRILYENDIEFLKQF